MRGNGVAQLGAVARRLERYPPLMLFMVIERFRNRDAKPIYERLGDRGRMMPEGLEYRGSWIEATFDRCFQVMECADERLLHEWASRWSDLMEFEFVPVQTSEQARARALAEPQRP
jgi:Protein of unknown function (DUF3303)